MHFAHGQMVGSLFAEEDVDSVRGPLFYHNDQPEAQLAVGTKRWKLVKVPAFVFCFSGHRVFAETKMNS